MFRVRRVFCRCRFGVAAVGDPGRTARAHGPQPCELRSNALGHGGGECGQSGERHRAAPMRHSTERRSLITMCAGAPPYTGTIVDQIEYPLSPPDPVVSAAGAAGLFHAEEPVDPVIKPGTLTDAKQTLGAIEEVIGSL